MPDLAGMTACGSGIDGIAESKRKDQSQNWNLVLATLMVPDFLLNFNLHFEAWISRGQSSQGIV